MLQTSRLTRPQLRHQRIRDERSSQLRCLPEAAGVSRQLARLFSSQSHLDSNVKQSDTRTKPVEVNIYQPRAGFTQRDDASTVPVKDQFIWIAKLKAHPGKREDLVKVILTHTANVERDEDETLTFLVLESSDDADGVVLFERYTSEKYFRETHFTSKSMAEYREKVGEQAVHWTMTLSLTSCPRCSHTWPRGSAKATKQLRDSLISARILPRPVSVLCKVGLLEQARLPSLLPYRQDKRYRHL